MGELAGGGRSPGRQNGHGVRFGVTHGAAGHGGETEGGAGAASRQEKKAHILEMSYKACNNLLYLWYTYGAEW